MANTTANLSIQEQILALCEQGVPYEEINKLIQTTVDCEEDTILMNYFKVTNDIDEENETKVPRKVAPITDKLARKSIPYAPYKETLAMLILFGETIPNIATHLNQKSRTTNIILKGLNIPLDPPEELPTVAPLDQDDWESVVTLSLDGYSINQIKAELPHLSYGRIVKFCLDNYVPYNIVENEKIECMLSKKENDIYALYVAGHTQASIGERYGFKQSYISRIIKSAKTNEQVQGLKRFYALDEEDYYSLFEKYLDKKEWNQAMVFVSEKYNIPVKWANKILILKGVNKSGYLKNKKYSRDVFTNLVEEGLSQMEIAEKLKIDQGTVSRYCKKFGLTTQHAHNKVIDTPMEQEIVKALKEGKTCYELAQQLDCAYATILKIGKTHELAFDREIHICNTPAEKAIVDALQKGLRKDLIASMYKCSYNTVYKIARKHDLTRPYQKGETMACELDPQVDAVHE